MAYAYILGAVFGGVVGFAIHKLIDDDESNMLCFLIVMCALLGVLGVVSITVLLPREIYLVESKEITPRTVITSELLKQYDSSIESNFAKNVIITFSINQNETLNLTVIDMTGVGIVYNSNIKSHKENVVRIEKHKSRVKSGRWYSVIFPKNERIFTVLFYSEGSFVQEIAFGGTATRKISTLRTPVDR